MKCDELKRYTLDVDYDGNVISVENDDGGYMDAYEVEATIEELKTEINRKDGVGQRWFERCMEARAENIKLKRSLWIARAEMCHRFDVDIYLRKHLNSWYNENCLTFNDACVAMEVKMCKAESKCRVKAEEYK